MSKATVNVGAAPDDGTGDTLRAAFVNIQANFDELYNLPITRLVVGGGADAAPLTYANLTYTETSGPRLQVGSGSAGSTGAIIGNLSSGNFGIWPTSVTPSATNVNFQGNSTSAYVQAAATSGEIGFYVAGAERGRFPGTAGAGPSFTMGTATTDVGLRATQTWNASGVTFTGIKYTLTNSASAAGSKLLDLIVGSTSTFDVHKTGVIGQAGVAFASLPTGVAGMLAYVTDASTATWGATIAGGGANKVMAFYNGTNWTVAGA